MTLAQLEARLAELYAETAECRRRIEANEREARRLQNERMEVLMAKRTT